jgi:hypothetical protein
MIDISRFLTLPVLPPIAQMQVPQKREKKQRRRVIVRLSLPFPSTSTQPAAGASTMHYKRLFSAAAGWLDGMLPVAVQTSVVQQVPKNAIPWTLVIRFRHAVVAADCHQLKDSGWPLEAPLAWLPPVLPLQ